MPPYHRHESRGSVGHVLRLVDPGEGLTTVATAATLALLPLLLLMRAAVIVRCAVCRFVLLKQMRCAGLVSRCT